MRCRFSIRVGTTRDHDGVVTEQERPDPWDRSNYPHLVQFLDRLDQAGLTYDLKVRPASARLSVLRPPHRWDIKFSTAGSVEVQKYDAVGEVRRELAVLDEVFADIE